MELIRQGDLMLIPTTEVPTERKPREDGVIQEGETTGHMHRIADVNAAQVFSSGWREDVFVSVGEAGVSIIHEEHKAVTLQPNTVYRVNRAREHDYLEQATRIVAD